MKLQQLFEGQFDLAEVFWVNPRTNQIVSCIDPHIRCILANPKPFGLTLDEVPDESDRVARASWISDADREFSPFKHKLYQRGWVRMFTFSHDEVGGTGFFDDLRGCWQRGWIQAMIRQNRPRRVSLDAIIDDEYEVRSFNIPAEWAKLEDWLGTSDSRHQ